MAPNVAPALDAGVGRAVEAEGARDPDRAELLGEALQPAAREREVAVDPDERARRHLLAVEQRVDDDERLLVLRARGIEQLAAGRRARLPVGEDEGAAARDRDADPCPAGRAGDGLLRIGPELDDEEVADVVPRRVRDERGAPLGRARDRVAAERHQETASAAGRGRASRGSRARTRSRPGRSGSTSAAAAAPTCWTSSGRPGRRAARGRPGAAPCRSRARRSTPPRRCARSSRCSPRSRGGPAPSRASARGGRRGRACRASSRCRPCRRRGGGSGSSRGRRAPSRGGPS